ANLSIKKENLTKPELDILILTDANSMGINLQDASVVINYDLAWTPDVIIQRAGRIMRFWQEPRLVKIYAFVASFGHDDITQGKLHRLVERFRSLSLRSKHAQEITEMPIFPEKDNQVITSLGDFSKVTIEDFGEIDIKEIEEYSGGSPFLMHITALKQNETRVSELDDDINSALLYDGKDDLVYLLIRNNDEYEWIIYNVTREREENFTNDEILELLRCSPDEEPAPIDPDILENYTQYLRNNWCETNDIPYDEVERVCALYLKSKDEKPNLEDMIEQNAETWN
ncbi:MAG: helicase-related protein, partial [Chloroflexota bacterium]